MKIRMALACVLAGALVAVAAPASAAKTKGVRFEASLQKDFNLVKPDGMGGSIGGQNFSFTGGDPHGDIRIGYDLPFGFTPLIGIGFKSYSQEQVVTPPNDGDVQTRSFSGTEFVLALEGRFYFKKHKKGLQPFVSLEYNTSFLSGEVASDVTGEKDGVADINEQLTYVADTGNHGEINIAFGTEYKFSQAFGIGGKWGVGIGLKGNDDLTPIPDGGADQTTIRNDSNTIGTSASVYAAWRI